jgi:hypothetical protein
MRLQRIKHCCVSTFQWPSRDSIGNCGLGNQNESKSLCTITETGMGSGANEDLAPCLTAVGGRSSPAQSKKQGMAVHGTSLEEDVLSNAHQLL